MQKEALLNLDIDQIYDEKMNRQLEAALSYVYPYREDTKLYTQMSVSELKKQSQIGREEEAMGTGREEDGWIRDLDEEKAEDSVKETEAGGTVQEAEAKEGRRFMAGQAVLREVLHTTGRWNVFPSMNCTAFQIQKRPCFRSMSRDIWIRSLMSGSTPGIFGNLWKAAGEIHGKGAGRGAAF